MNYSGALITGGGDRQGRAMAVALAAREIPVAVHYSTNASGAAETKSIIERAGGRAITLAAGQPPEHFARQRQSTPLKRGADVGDIIGAMNFFLDAPAVTGQLICVDGGQHLAW
ncbi:hypothetical protein GCM10007939_22080 [Amylibacter marinus]|uniref:Enoyl-(Acyl carrier protein) reductase n=1 Tax=Amylibacter marinus TaxID=1475483 RepID=A0ABQ5VXI1_9RHOB|nr:hypothetical protein GCM10007939_22080 [Amylibacter marinus]